MIFEYLDESLWPAADAIILHYQQKGFRVKVEKPLNEADNYRPTLIFEKRSYITEVVEIKQEYKVDRTLSEFVQKCLAEQRPVKIWVCVPDIEGNEPSMTVKNETLFHQNGIGRYHFDGNQIEEMQIAVECHLRFVLPPGPVLPNQRDILSAIGKFNGGNRVDGVRDIGELLEAAITDLGVYAHRKNRFSRCPSITDFTDKDFDGQVRKLGEGTGGIRILEPNTVTDIISAKNTRNLSHHPRDVRQKRQLDEQAKAKMSESIRLLRELSRIKNGIR